MTSIFQFNLLGFYLYVYTMLRGKGAYRRRDYIFCLKEEKIAGTKLNGFKVNNMDKKKKDTQRRLERSNLNRRGTQKWQQAQKDARPLALRKPARPISGLAYGVGLCWPPRPTTPPRPAAPRLAPPPWVRPEPRPQLDVGLTADPLSEVNPLQ